MFHLDLAYPDHPAVSMEVSTDARIVETEDGCHLDVTVLNHLPCVSVYVLKKVLLLIPR